MDTVEKIGVRGSLIDQYCHLADYIVRLASNRSYPENAVVAVRSHDQLEKTFVRLHGAIAVVADVEELCRAHVAVVSGSVGFRQAGASNHRHRENNKRDMLGMNGDGLAAYVLDRHAPFRFGYLN